MMIMMMVIMMMTRSYICTLEIFHEPLIIRFSLDPDYLDDLIEPTERQRFRGKVSPGMKAKDSAPPKASLVLDGIPKMVTLGVCLKLQLVEDHFEDIFYIILQ